MVQRVFTTLVLVGWIGLGGFAAAAQEAPPSLAGASISNQTFDANAGTLTYTLRNDSNRDLIAWVATTTVHHASGHTSTRSALQDSWLQHALATTPGFKTKLGKSVDSYLPAGAAREITVRLRPDMQVTTATMPATHATVALSAVVFADGRAIGEGADITRIVDLRKRDAADSLPVLQALQRTRANKDVDAQATLRAAAEGLPQHVATMMTRAADQLEKQPDAASRERVLSMLLEVYELRQAIVAKPLIIQ